MADLITSSFSQTDASNTAVSGISIAEGCPPSNINDAQRATLGAVKRMVDRLGPTLTAGGTANAITLTYGVGPAAYTQGEVFSFIAAATNSGAATLNVSGLGARSITKNGATALQGGEIVAGAVVTVMYDGSGFQLISAGAASPYGVLKNALINGDMEVWQRGASIAVTASSTAYAVDRWYIATGVNQAFTIAQQSGLTNGSRYCARVQRNSGQTGTGAVVFGSPLTTDMLVPLRGQTVTISARVRTGANWSPTSGNLTMAFYVGTGTEGKRGGGFTSEATVASVTTALGTSSAVTWIIATSGSTVPTTATQGELQFTFTPTGTAGAADYFDVDEIQVEAAAGVTLFDRRDYQAELARCQRFALVHDFASSTGSGFFAGFADNTTAAIVTGVPPVTTRVPFTGATVSNATNFMIRRAGGSVSLTSLAWQQAWPNSLALVANVASGLTAGEALVLRINNTNCKIEWTGAEL